MATTLLNKLHILQTKIKAPKSNYNDYGGFSYRSAENILELLKPLLTEVGCILLLDTEIVNIGDRYYVKSTAELKDIESGELIAKTNAWAREQQTRTKMDESQLSGAAMSYSVKYCLGLMFLLDDNKDADALPPDKPAQKNDQDKWAKDVATWKSMDDGERVELIKKNNLLLAQKFSGDMKEKMIATINDPKFNSLNGQQTLAGRIRDQLLKQTENLPPPAPKTKGARDAKFSLPPDPAPEEKQNEVRPEDIF